MNFTTIRWDHSEQALVLLDQTLLPSEIVYETCRDLQTVAEAIKQLKVRGAPAIGVAAAFGVVVGVQNSKNVDLIKSEDEDTCLRIGENGAELLQSGQTVLTHCNAGALATSGIGTALAVIYQAHSEGKKIHVYADETRPVLQGARLTTWELVQAGIGVTLICDSMAAQVMKEVRIDFIIVGADRVAANGDVANKIGTYGVAVLADAHDVPFYVAAPFSSIDLSVKSGHEIPIEEREGTEISYGEGKLAAPEEAEVYNPAFDVTPACYVSAIITERGIAKQPFADSLTALSHQIWEPAVSG